MPDPEAIENADAQTMPIRPITSTSAVWPPPPRRQLQTVPINVLAPGRVFGFYFSSVVMAGVVVGGISSTVDTLLRTPGVAILGFFAGAIAGVGLGIPEGIAVGLLAAILHMCNLSSNTIGRILCWACTVVNAAIALTISLFMFPNMAQRNGDWALVVFPIVTTYLIWKASRFIATQFVGRF